MRACRNASTVVDEWGFMEALMTDEAQTHAVVKVEYDTVMEKLGAAAASGSLSAEDAKQLAQSELDARLKAEKEALMAKEQLTAAEVRHCETLLYPRKRLKPHAAKRLERLPADGRAWWQIRWRTSVETAEARAVEAEKRMIAAEKRGTEGEKRLREETERLRSHAELRVAESERLAKEVRTSTTALSHGCNVRR